MFYTGVLNLVRSHRPFIKHVRIVIGSSKSQERERRRRRCWEKQQQQDETSRTRSQTWACENEDIQSNVNDGLDTTLDHPKSDRRNINANPKITKNARSFSMDVMHPKLESIEPDDTGVEEEKNEVVESEDEDKNYHLLFVLDSDASAQTFVTDLHQRPCECVRSRYRETCAA